jgi:hypothetical protein
MATRTVQLSTDLYAAIWKSQKPGEQSEEEILRRILNLPPLNGSQRQNGHSVIGLYDRRNEVKFSPGFAIFRNYKGRRYAARVQAGAWYREDNGETYPTLNQLSDSIGASEDAWKGWLYRDENGQDRKIDELRKKASL